MASVIARKGHVVLIEALAGLREQAWVLHCVGSLTMDPHAAAAARAAAQAHDLAGRVHWHGVVEGERLREHYAAADLFVLPSLFEGYGMVLAEALAHGLPVVATDTGNAARLLSGDVPGDAGGAGIVVPPGNAVALRAALAALMSEPARRHALAAAARAARSRLPRWDGCCARWEAVLNAVTTAGPDRR
ncbi:MAG: glycosyltransferase family 4 protein [Rubrivivax sp.]